jgi:hypothetical protein
VQPGKLEQHDCGREPDPEQDAEARPGDGERGGDERAAERMPARPRHVERHEVHAVPVKRRPRQRVPEDELHSNRCRPRGNAADRRVASPARPEPPRSGEDEQEGDNDLPRQRHDLGHAHADRVEGRVQQGHDRLERGRRR